MASPKKRISVLLAAGASTRMKSSTSKLLHHVHERAILDWALASASAVGDAAVLVVGHQRVEVEKRALEVRPKNLEIYFALQKEQKGTADAVRCALQVLSKEKAETTDIFIMGADSPLLQKETVRDFVSKFEKSNAFVSVMTMRIYSPNAYGRIVRDSSGAIQKIVEFKDATAEERAIDEVNSGFYLVNLGALREALAQVTNENKSKEFYLTDIISFARKKSWLVTTHEISADEAIGVNTREDLAIVDQTFKARQNSEWMRAGVTILDPHSVRIGPNVELEPDVVIETGVQLKGKTKIKSGSVIGAYSILEDMTIGENSKIEAFCHLKGASVGEKASIGPFARLRPGSRLDDEVHIGNFVEVKNSHLKDGVKAGHLAYLGDSVVGEETNIGAGTITCNYDGFAKHETKIGKNVFVGSNTSLVAPVSLGDGAIVGAGSVITKNVAKDSLVFERAEQIEKKGRAKKFRGQRKKKGK